MIVFSSRILELDPLNLDCLWIHLTNLYHLSRKNSLFLLAHELVDKHPTQPISWFAVGSFYLLTQKNMDARRYFAKATRLDPACFPAWIGYAHTLAFEGEHDQAISAYAQASKHFKGYGIKWD